MSRINLGVNLAEVETDIVAIPEDRYPVRILESSKIKTSSNGNPMIVWVVQVTEGDYEGRKLFINTSLVPAALFTLKNLVDAAGISFDEDGFELEECFGLEFLADVVVEQYNGKDVNKVTKCYPLGQ